MELKVYGVKCILRVCTEATCLVGQKWGDQLGKFTFPQKKIKKEDHLNISVAPARELGAAGRA